MKHGSDSTYRNYACRCTDCRRAHADKQQAGNRRRQQRLATSDVEHGRYTTYINWGCRCAPCTDAWRLVCLDYRKRKAAAA